MSHTRCLCSPTYTRTCSQTREIRACAPKWNSPSFPEALRLVSASGLKTRPQPANDPLLCVRVCVCACVCVFGGEYESWRPRSVRPGLSSPVGQPQRGDGSGVVCLGPNLSRKALLKVPPNSMSPLFFPVPHTLTHRRRETVDRRKKTCGAAAMRLQPLPGSTAIPNITSCSVARPKSVAA